MKKIVLVIALILATLTTSASETLYFTYNQSLRAVTLLNNENELMIYCGYEDELPTYCLVNEVWAEQISSSFYEIWLHGYDAYTGEEIYMPIDMECIWLLRHGHILSAAQTLRFRNYHPRPTFAWRMPPYNPWVRGPRPHVYYYSYHYDIHRPGWSWRHPHPNHHYHPYYCRPMSHPAPLPHAPFTPGKDMPGYKVTSNTNGEIGYEYLGTPNTNADRITASRSATVVKNDPSSRSGNRITSDRSGNTVTTTDRISGRSSSATAPTIETGRGSSDNSGRSVSTSRSDNGRGNSSASRSDNGRGNSSASRSDNGRSSSASRSDNGRGNSSASRSDNGRSSSASAPSNTGRSTSTSSSRGSSASSPSNTGRSANTSSSRSSSASTPSSTSRSTSTSSSRSSSASTPSSTGRSASTSSSRSNAGSSRSTNDDNNNSTRGTSTRGTSNRR